MVYHPGGIVTFWTGALIKINILTLHVIVTTNSRNDIGDIGNNELITDDTAIGYVIGISIGKIGLNDSEAVYFYEICFIFHGRDIIADFEVKVKLFLILF